MDYCHNELDPVLRPIVEVLARERPHGLVQIRAAIAKLAQAIAIDGETKALVEPEAAAAEAAPAKREQGIAEHNVTIQAMVRTRASCPAVSVAHQSSASSFIRAAIQFATSIAILCKPSVSSKPRLKRGLA